MAIIPKVSCILVNWNGWKDTIECLQALRKCTYPNLEVIVVDNGSTDGSASQIRSAYPEVLLMESGKNLGFAGGNNIGIRYALRKSTDYIWLLNNDTKPDPEALSALVAKAQTDNRIGAVSSICYFAQSPEVVQVWAGTRVNLWIGYTDNSVVPHHDEWFEALYGASLLLTRSALDDVGLLDEGFFHSWEETELCLRLRKKGWRLAAAPGSRVLHKFMSSTGGKSPQLERYFTTGGLRILRLHSPAPSLAMFLFLSARFLRRLVRFNLLSCKSVWAGVKDYRRTRPIVQQIR